MSGYQSQYQSGAAPEGAPTLPHRISWGAILAGALVAIAIGTALNVLGFGIGLMNVDAQARDTPSAGTFGLVGSLWLLFSNLLGLALGGYVAARLSGTSDEKDATLHGATVWAVAYLVSAMLVGSVASGLGRTASDAISHVAGGAVQGAGSAAGAAAQQVDPDELVQRARIALSGPSDVGRMTTEQRGAEIGSLVAKRAADGNLSNDDRTRLNRLVAAEAGISEGDADARVRGYEAQAQQAAQRAEETARQAADAAAKGAAIGAFWIFAALLLGAGAAVIGARTGVRDVVTLADRRVVADRRPVA